jgi:hypothetical protein
MAPISEDARPPRHLDARLPLAPPINPEGSHSHPARDPRALAQSRLSLLLALEVAPTGRATADRDERVQGQAIFGIML